MNDQLEMMKKLAKRVEKIALQIETIHLKTRLEIIKDDLENLKLIDEEISDLIDRKYSSINHTEVLMNIFEESTDLLNAGRKVLRRYDLSKNGDKDKIEMQKVFLKIKQLIMKSIKKLDDYFKMNLNLKFHQHGLTAKSINDRMNELKELFR